MNVKSYSFQLLDHVAIVTGASRGIGYAIACGLSAAGARVTGVGRSLRPQEGDGNVSFDYCVCDVTNPESFSSLVESVSAQTGRIDILVNAAGITVSDKESEDSFQTFRATLASNLTAVFDCCSTVIPFMKQNGSGSIINITSIGAALGFPRNPGYVASKGGLAALTRSLALDFGPYGIRINNLVPGYIRTAMTQASYENPEHQQARTARTMLGRWGYPEELVGPAIFLASSASSYVTGTDLYVDGGWTAKGL